MAWRCSGSSQRGFFSKGELRYLGKRPCTHAAGRSTRSEVCGHDLLPISIPVYLGRLIKGVQSEVVSWPQPGAVVQRGECRTQSALGQWAGNCAPDIK